MKDVFNQNAMTAAKRPDPSGCGSVERLVDNDNDQCMENGVIKPSITYGICEEIYCLGNEKRTAFGIVAYSDAATNGTACIIASRRDVSCDRDGLQALIDACNRHGLSPAHLDDVIEDFFASM